MYYYFYDINRIRKYILDNKKVYLYPEGRNTIEILKQLGHSDVKIAGVIDRKPRDYQDVKAYHVEHIINDEQSVVFITSPQYEAELISELKTKKYKGIIETFFDKNEDEVCFPNRLNMKRMDLVLTARCTLRCKRCANLMQYYEHPTNVELEVIIKSMEKLLNAVDGIKTVYVLGGEPFLYKQLNEVILYLKKQQKIRKINVVTNGTLCPNYDKRYWDEICGKNVTILISNYGKLSIKKEELIRKCMEHSINCEVSDNDVFYDTGNMIKRGRSLEELQKVFDDCNTQCRSLYNGELHFCPRSAHGTDLELIEKREEDYIDILHATDGSKLKEQIRKFVNRKSYVEACDFCDIRCPGYYEHEYPVAEQVSHVLKVKES